MNSFYGGQSGVSFVLKGRFTSIQNMIAAFKLGSNYTDVWYNEFAIIDTINKNHEDNGKIYRRGLDYQNSMGGAEYIGQVVGPEGGCPYFEIDTLDYVKEKALTVANGEDVHKRYPTDKDENPADGKPDISINGPGTDLGIFEFSDADALVPGKDGNTYHDSIKYTWVNIREDNASSDSWFYVGFEIPYLVTEIETHSKSAYNDAGVREDGTTIERIDDLTHPYYQAYDIGLPKGIKGDTLRHLRVITPTAQDIIYDYKNINTTKVDEYGNFVSEFGEPGYEGQEDDIRIGRKILVFDYYIFDNEMQGEHQMVYLGDYNMIKDVILDNDGTVTVEYTHDDDRIFEKKIRWITNVVLTTGNGENGGKLTIDYNNGTPTDEFYLTWIKSLVIDEEGSVTYTYAGTPDDSLLPEGADRLYEGIYKVSKLLKWFKNVRVDSATGILTFEDNQGETYPFQLDWIDDIYIDESNGRISLHHVDGDKNIGEHEEGLKAEVLEAKLKLIVSATITNNGDFIFTCNTGEEIHVANEDGNPFILRWLTDIKLNDGILADKHIQVQYNTDEEDVYHSIGDSINYIADMVVRTTDWHLLVLYSDPTHRLSSANELDENGQDKNGNYWANNITGSDDSFNSANIWWQDMGPIKDQAGVLIGFNVTEEEVLADPDAEEDIIKYLNKHYPNGLTEEDNSPMGISLKGKIITYAKDSKNQKEFYAFNYQLDNWTWYYLGEISDSGTRDAILYYNDGSAVTKDAARKTMSNNGLMFSYFSDIVSDTDMPIYWGSQNPGE